MFIVLAKLTTFLLLPMILKIVRTSSQTTCEYSKATALGMLPHYLQWSQDLGCATPFHDGVKPRENLRISCRFDFHGYLKPGPEPQTPNPEPPKPWNVRIPVHAEPHADCGQWLYSSSCLVSKWCRRSPSRPFSVFAVFEMVTQRAQSPLIEE